jgi:hypothetical protein
MTLEFIGESYTRRQESKAEAREVQHYRDIKDSIEGINPDSYTDPKLREIAEAVKEQFNDVFSAAVDYIKAADTHDEFTRRELKTISPEKKDALQSVSDDRVATHNFLMNNINILGFSLQKLNIDNKIITDIINEDRKLNLKNETDRRSVERWARIIAKYLATVSETTL